MKFIGAKQPFLYADDVNIFVGRELIIKKNTESVEAANKEIEIQVNYDKTKYMVMFWEQNADRSHSIKSDDITFEMVEDIKYLGKNTSKFHSRLH